MQITWFGHSSFRVEIGDQILLVDPWLTGNPMFEGHDKTAAISRATHILLTHGHGDHSGDSLAIARELDIPIVGIYDLMSHWEATETVQTVGFNKGGTVHLGDVAVTMVNAVHSSSIGSDSGPIYAGSEAGFMIRSFRNHTYPATLGSTMSKEDKEKLRDWWKVYRSRDN